MKEDKKTSYIPVWIKQNQGIMSVICITLVATIFCIVVNCSISDLRSVTMEGFEGLFRFHAESSSNKIPIKNPEIIFTSADTEILNLLPEEDRLKYVQLKMSERNDLEKLREENIYSSKVWSSLLFMFLIIAVVIIKWIGKVKYRQKTDKNGTIELDITSPGDEKLEIFNCPHCQKKKSPIIIPKQ